MNTCYAKVIGGLGNQLFIAAAGYAYAKKYGKEFAIDASSWSASQGTNAMNYKDTIFKNFKYEFSSSDNTFQINEKRFDYDELPYHEGDVSLNGYFQSLKYFQSVKDEFVSLLDLPDVSTKNLKNDNVAVHIRRGDYLNYPEIHHVCKTKYFEDQLLQFKGYQINVFTDSIDYVLNEFRDSNFNIIKSNSELIDLTLMSKHKNIICSNSSFSWWASFLGEPKNKIIVPDRWFNNFQPHDDIYRPEFTKVAVE